MNDNPWVINHIQKTCPNCKSGLTVDDKINEECRMCGNTLCNCECHNKEKVCKTCREVVKCGLN